jgi:hypothetical protein
MHHSIGDLAEVLDNLGVFRAAPQDLVESCPSLGAPRPKGAGVLMRLSLLNREVVSESGHQLGHVHDGRGELVEGHLRVIGPGRR